MNFDEYNAAMRNIHQQLESIAERTAGQAWLGTANPNNPAFVELMQIHENLVQRATQLTEQMAKQVGI